MRIKEGREWMFRYHLLPKTADQNTTQETTLESIASGNNPGVLLTLTVVRLIHLPHCSFLLCTSTRPFNLQSLVILILSYPQSVSHEEVNIDNYGIVKKSVIKVHEPFCIKEEPQIVPTIIAPLANFIHLKAKQDSKIKRTAEELREQANSFFKARKYVEAIHLYENALASIHRPDSRRLSILYSNAAACLFELRLYTSCIILSEVSIMIDPTYNKGYYRKLRSLLELKGFELVTPLLFTISTLIPKTDLDLLN